jgi:alpha-D-ribose 1-methylphosphonate 5-phosphate C-P lyase
MVTGKKVMAAAPSPRFELPNVPAYEPFGWGEYAIIPRFPALKSCNIWVLPSPFMVTGMKVMDGVPSPRFELPNVPAYEPSG